MSSRLTRYALLWTVAAVIATPASAQSSLATGTRVRLSMTEKGRAPLIGALASVTADSIAVINDGGATFSVPRGSVRRVDVSAGRRRMVLRDALIGGGASFVAGAILGAATYDPDAFLSDSRGGDAAFVGAIFGAAGLVTGAIIGAFHVVEAWRPVNLDVRPAVLTGWRSGNAYRVGISPRIVAAENM